MMNRTQESSSTGSLMSTSSQYSPQSAQIQQLGAPGNTGEPFDGSAELLLVGGAGTGAPSPRITRLEVAYGDFVFALRVIYSNGKMLRHGEAPIDCRKLNWAQKWRARASSTYTPSRFENAKWKGLNLSKDEYIIQVGGTSGRALHSLWFKTNKAEYGPFGRSSGTPFEQSFPQGNSLHYFFGKVKYTGETTQAETVPCTVVTELGFGYAATSPQQATAAQRVQQAPATPVRGENSNFATQGTHASADARWKKTAKVLKLAKGFTPRAEARQPANASQDFGEPPVQLFTPLSEVLMEARTESIFKTGSYNSRGSAHINPFLEQ